MNTEILRAHFPAGSILRYRPTLRTAEVQFWVFSDEKVFRHAFLLKFPSLLPQMKIRDRHIFFSFLPSFQLSFCSWDQNPVRWFDTVFQVL